MDEPAPPEPRGESERSSLPVRADTGRVQLSAADSAAIDIVAALENTTRLKLAKRYIIRNANFFEWLLAAIVVILGLVVSKSSVPTNLVELAVMSCLVVPILAATAATVKLKAWRTLELTARDELIADLKRKLRDSEELVGVIAAGRDREAERALRQRESLRNIFDQHLHEVMVALALDKSDARITLYLVQMEGVLVLQGRWCVDPLLRLEGRNVYPSNEGCIGEAWRARRSSRVDTSRDEAGRYAFHAGTGFPEERLEALRMKSKSYLGLRLDESSTKQLGVVLLESPRAHAFGKNLEEKVVTMLDPTGEHGKRFVQLIQSHHAAMFDMRLPQSRGF